MRVSFRWLIFHSDLPINISHNPHLMLPGLASFSWEVVYDTTSINSVQLCYPLVSLIANPCDDETCTYFASHSRIFVVVFVFSSFLVYLHCFYCPFLCFGKSLWLIKTHLVKTTKENINILSNFVLHLKFANAIPKKTFQNSLHDSLSNNSFARVAVFL